MHRALVWAAAIAAACAPPVARRVAAPPPVERAEVVQRTPPPPPLSGGTLLVTRDRTRAVMSDAERDRVWIVEIDRGLFAAGRFQLRPGDEPGRLVEDGAGRVHVVLRGTGEVATFDPIGQRAIARRPVCGSPRGIAWDQERDLLHVACAEGALYTLDPARGPAHRAMSLAGDLRDVVIDRADGKTSVSRFRAAETISIDDGSRAHVPTISMTSAFGGPPSPFGAAVAWRTIAAPGGGVWMVHQREMKAELPSSVQAYYGNGVMHAGIARITNGRVDRTMTIARAVLPLDLAVSDAGMLAVVLAGDGEVLVVDPARVEDEPITRSSAGVRPVGTVVAASLRRPVSAAWVGETLLVQYLDPPAIAAYGEMIRTGETFLELGEPAPRDEGFEIFHTPTLQRIACASCHPEGMDDGHVWHLGDVGRRRTQTLGGGILDTAPYHWAGDLPDVRAFTESIYVNRMGGRQLDDHEIEALGQWIHSIPDPSQGDASATESVARGRAIFEGEASCASCHEGARGTDGRNHDVGTGGSFQTPPLVGLDQRAPYFHDGCARTLEERFDRCHTEGHGNVAALDEGERADLIVYLRSR